MKGKWRGTKYIFSTAFRKHGVVLLATYMRIYKKSDSVDIKGMSIVQKGMPHRCHHVKTGRVCSVTQHAAGILLNTQVKGKTLAKRINVHIDHIEHSKSRDSYLKMCEGKYPEKEGSQRERYLGSTQVPACSTQRSTLCGNQWKGAKVSGTYSL
ncbi:60S ribosomal protein L21 [Tupaia chinensis]|uniref:60S ribosomal protein L21 n=1 Tax=Tupaia chinensis TaxID=246437 RepID=L9LDY5_TUPCH|nr:60S ribosomal protein L21 [Tupaia chinensis]